MMPSAMDTSPRAVPDGYLKRQRCWLAVSGLMVALPLTGSIVLGLDCETLHVNALVLKTR